MISALDVRGVRLSALLLASLCGLAAVHPARAETYPPISPSLTTPDQVETSIGTLKYRDGVPDQATATRSTTSSTCSAAFRRSSMGYAVFPS